MYVSRPVGSTLRTAYAVRGVFSIDPASAHWLAGLWDAEGSFMVRRQNRTRNWSCRASMKLRDDDARLLRDLRSQLGIGHIARIPARGGSRPQVAWVIDSKLECQALATLFSQYPLRGRKAGDLRIWSEVVALWAAAGQSGLAAEEASRVDALVEELAGIRAFGRPSNSEPKHSNAGLLSYFGGFFAGDGWLGFNKGKPRLAIHTRRDDRPLLETFAEVFGIGTVVDVKACPPSAPTARWHVTAMRDMQAAVKVLNAAPLRGRKLRQYLAWRPAAIEAGQASRDGRPIDVDVISTAQTALERASRYASEADCVAEPEPFDARYEYALLLADWAANFSGRPTAAAYDRDRLSYWPDRNTLARVFGSWAAAAAAAGFRPVLRASG